MHKPGELMQNILADVAGKAESMGVRNAGVKAALPRRKLFAWCIWDVIDDARPGVPVVSAVRRLPGALGEAGGGVRED